MPFSAEPSLQTLFFFLITNALFTYFVYRCRYMREYAHALVHVWRLEDHYHVGSRGATSIVKLGLIHLHLSPWPHLVS